MVRLIIPFYEFYRNISHALSPNHLIVSTRNGTRYLSNSTNARYIVKCKSLDQDKIAYFHYVIQVQLEDKHVSMQIVQMYIVVI